MIVRPTKIAYVLLIPTTCIGFLFGLLFSRQWYVPTGSRATPSDRSIPLAAVVDRVKDYLDQRSTGLDLVQTKEELGLNLLRPSWDEYEQGLRHAWTTFFGTAGDERFHKILDHLSLLPSPDDPLPKVVHTTDLTPRSEAPAQYNSWVEQNPDWRIHYLEDEEVDVWLKATLGDAPVVRKMEGMRGARGILRSDMFRSVPLHQLASTLMDLDTSSCFSKEGCTRTAIPHRSDLSRTGLGTPTARGCTHCWLRCLIWPVLAPLLRSNTMMRPIWWFPSRRTAWEGMRQTISPTGWPAACKSFNGPSWRDRSTPFSWMYLEMACGGIMKTRRRRFVPGRARR